MIDMKSFFDALPPSVWGAVGAAFGALITAVVTLISNSGSNKRLKVQLAHDAREKNIDRMKDLRKEIYISAVEELTKASSYFASIPVRDLDDINFSIDLQGLNVAAAKLSLVAPPNTQQAVDELGIEYAKLTFKIMAKIPPLRELKSYVQLYASMYEQSMSEVRRIVSAMTHHNEAAQVDELVYAGLQNTFNYFSEQAESFTDKKSVAQNDFNKLSVKFGRDLMSDMRPLAELQTKVIIAIRKDLGVETDEVLMSIQVKKQWVDVAEAVESEVAKSNL